MSSCPSTRSRASKCGRGKRPVPARRRGLSICDCRLSNERKGGKELRVTNCKLQTQKPRNEKTQNERDDGAGKSPNPGAAGRRLLSGEGERAARDPSTCRKSRMSPSYQSAHWPGDRDDVFGRRTCGGALLRRRQSVEIARYVVEIHVVVAVHVRAVATVGSFLVRAVQAVDDAPPVARIDGPVAITVV